MTTPTRHRLVLILLWLVFYGSFTLFSPPLLDDADSVHAEVAREMLTRHDFVTLYANGIRYLEKAPLYYWTEAASMALFGVDTAATRIPLALSVLALTLLLYQFALRALASPRAALYTGLITLSSFGIFIFSRINIPDILVCLFLTLALYAFYLSEQHDHPPLAPCLVFALALALNVLTKGLIGIVFPVAIVLAYLLLTRGARGTLARLARLHLLAATLLFFAIATPWHVLIALANPGHGHPAPISHATGHWVVPYPTDGNVHGWAWFYFINEQLYRYLNLRVPHDYDTSPLWLFLGLIFIWLMPWSAWLPSAIPRATQTLRRSQNHRRQSRQLSWAQAAPFRHLGSDARTSLLLLLWLTLPLAFFLFSTRQEYYVLPALPPMILLLAAWLNTDSKVAIVLHQAPGPREDGDGLSPETLQILQATEMPPEATRGPFTLRIEGSDTRIANLLLIAGSLIALALVIFLLHTAAPTPGTDLASLLQQNPADYALSFGHFLDLNAAALGLFRLPLALTALACFLGPLANYLLRRRNEPHAATLSLATAAFVFLFASWLGLRTFSPTLTSSQLAQAIQPQLHPEDLLVIHGEYESGSTLGFYLRRNDIHILEGRSSNLWYGSFFPDAPRIFETRATLAARWAGPQRIFLWQDPHDPDRPALTSRDLSPLYVIASSGGKQILSNQPIR